MLSIFSSVCRPSVRLRWRNVSSCPLPGFNWIICFIYLFFLVWSCIYSLYSLDINPLEKCVLEASCPSMPRNATQQWKERSQWYTQQPKWSSRDYCWVKRQPGRNVSILCESIYVTFLRRHNSGNREQTGVFQVWRRGGAGVNGERQGVVWNPDGGGHWLWWGLCVDPSSW